MGWFPWAKATLGIDIPRPIFIVANSVLAIAAFAIARVGWRRPRLALVIPAATFVNAIVWHIGPSVTQRHVAPGLYSALLLYVPIGAVAFDHARRIGVPRGDIGAAAAIGTAIGIGVPLLARLIS